MLSHAVSWISLWSNMTFCSFSVCGKPCYFLLLRVSKQPSMLPSPLNDGHRMLLAMSLRYAGRYLDDSAYCRWCVQLQCHCPRLDVTIIQTAVSFVSHCTYIFAWCLLVWTRQFDVKQWKWSTVHVYTHDLLLVAKKVSLTCGAGAGWYCLVIVPMLVCIYGAVHHHIIRLIMWQSVDWLLYHWRLHQPMLGSTVG